MDCLVGVEEDRELILGSSWLGFINIEASMPSAAVVEPLGAVRRHEWIACVRPILENKTTVEKSVMKGFYSRTGKTMEQKYQ